MFLDSVHPVARDERVRDYLLPKRILKIFGEVKDTDVLFEEKNRQSSLREAKTAILHSVPGNHAALLLDFGFEFHGGVSISTAMCPNNTHLRLRFGESAREAMAELGEKGACNDHSPRDFTALISPLSQLEFGATGYRFLYIELLDEDCTISLRAIQGVFLHQPYEFAGSFVCSDETLNKIYDTAAYTCHLCLQNELWDGIKRDRLVWIGDMAPEMKTIEYVFGEVPQIMSGLEFAEENGRAEWIDTMPTYSLWWLINLQEWSAYCGKPEFILRNKTYCLDVIRRVLASIGTDGSFLPDNFIDWPSRGTGAEPAGAKALLAMALKASVKLAQALKEDDLAETCRAVYEKQLTLREDAKGYKQIAALLQLNGMADEKAQALLAEGKPEGLSTFMSYYILSAMAQLTDTQTVLNALKTYYGGMLDLGATTFWEDFDLAWMKNACKLDELDETKSDIHGDNGKFCYIGYRHSLCHGWSSGPVPFLTEQVLGIRVSGEGGSVVTIEPHLGELTFARGSIATPLGKLTVEHKQENGKILTTYQAPAGMKVILK